MKIVGISGGSGAGKTTVSCGLAKILPNSIVIDADPFFREATDKLEDKIYARIGVPKEEGVLNQNVFFRSKEAMDARLYVVKDYVSKRIEEAVAKLGAGKDFVIIDWCYLPMCDYFYSCDLTLCIKADFAIRYERLASRMKKVKSYSIEFGASFFEYEPEAFANRVRYSAIDEYGYPSEYVIKNDSDMESLNKTIKKIAINLMEMSKPNKNITTTQGNNSIPKFSRPKFQKPIIETRKGDVIPQTSILRPIYTTDTRKVAGTFFEYR